MNNELKHYGVKGMHWGVRRYQNYDGTLKAAGKRHAASIREHVSNKRSERKARKAYRDEAYKRSKSMTDDELRKANQRYNAEQQYRRNVQTDIEASRGRASTSARKIGGKFNDKAVEKVLEAAATVLVTSLLVGATKSPSAAAIGNKAGVAAAKAGKSAVSRIVPNAWQANLWQIMAR